MGLKQSQIKGLSERQVRRIEKGEGTTYEALRRLASAHRMDLESYLRELAANCMYSEADRKARVQNAGIEYLMNVRAARAGQIGAELQPASPVPAFRLR